MKKDVTDKLKVYVQDTGFPLDERWKTFIESDLGEESNFIVHFKSIDEDKFSYYDDLYIERYQTVYLCDVIERFEDALDNGKTCNFSRNQVNEIKEEVLRKLIKSFVFDW